MSYSKPEGPGARETACMLCRHAKADPDICGDKLEKRGLCAHVFCLFFATLLVRQENDRVGLMGYFPRDIQIAVWRAAQKRCCVCGQSGATIMCCKEDCGRWFHLPCAKEGGCVTLYIPNYSTYCPEHRPEQEVEATPEPGTNCLICMEPVEDRKTFRTLVCPACKRAWFHRDCIQGQAMRAGLLSLRCPLCRDIEEFLAQMFIMGIRIPFREPTWEDNDGFADLEERHSRCTARDCLYPGGREEAEEEGPWELLLCSSCAAEGTHRRCSGLRNHIQSWECDSCAGLGTASRDESELSGPSLTRQSGLEPACGSSASEAISPSSCTLVPSRLDPQSPSAEISSHSSHQHTAWQQSLLSSSPDTSSPTTSRSTCSSSPDHEDRVHSRRAGPGCRRTRSHQQGQAPDGPVRSRSRCDRSRRTTTRTEKPRRRETPTQTFPRCSRAHQQGQAQSPPVRSRSRRDRSSQTRPKTEKPRRRETPSWTSPRCSRAHQQGQVQSPPVQSRSRRDRSSQTRPRTERPRQRETSSQASPRRSRSRQQGQAQSPPVRSRSRRDRSHRTTSSAERPRQRETLSGTSPRRSRSHLQRQASNQPVLSRNHQDRSSRTAARAERPRRRGTPSGMSHRSICSRQRRLASIRTSNSSM
ncbi:PHD finger protein 7-like [Vidua macroura]|uniref:PHD finger protein 7-like n=1 Tax=Vidua macroura TaxID=187451 RepID=UPI0023A9138D|nr:PHD finger protein 7-like [Vidua macroura]